MADPAQTGQTLDEDDDFVEFEVDDWSQREANCDQPGLWDAAWEADAAVEDAVAQQIRTELTKKAANGAAAQQPTK
jgi:DSS1/SEM1 family